MERIFLYVNDVLDTPVLRYYALKRKFQERYLNPKAWNNGVTRSRCGGRVCVCVSVFVCVCVFCGDYANINVLLWIF